MRVRVFNSIDRNYFEFDKEFKEVIKLAKKLIKKPTVKIYYEAQKISDITKIKDRGVLIIEIAPSDPFTLTVFIVSLSVSVLLAITAVVVMALLNKGSIDKIQVSPSLRGSKNPIRKGGKIPIVLGRYRVFADHGALPFSSYKDDNQYIHQLFNFGYKGTEIDLNTLKIGETKIEKYNEVVYSSDTKEYYPVRVIETNINGSLIKKSGEQAIEIIRTTSSSTYKIAVAITAPSGLFKIDNSEKKPINISFTIDYRAVGTKSWIRVHTINEKLNKEKFRRLYEFSPSPTKDGKYDVRVVRDSVQSNSSNVVDTLYFSAMQCYIQSNSKNRDVVFDAHKFNLLAVKIKATDQLQGLIDEINAEVTLTTRAYTKIGSGPSAWTLKKTRNPASALLYVLTDKLANAAPLADDDINWSEFEEFYLFCEKHGFTTDAMISAEVSISSICDFIATSNLAQIKKTGDKIGIFINSEKVSYTQLFTPLNALNMKMSKSFNQRVKQLRLKYVDSSIGYEEVIRTVSLDNNQIIFDLPQREEDSVEINLFGITNPTHAAKIGKVKLLESILRTRSYSWTTDIEGILCTVGDVVLLSNDLFLYGIGQSRIKDIQKEKDKLILSLSNEIKIPKDDTYLIRVRDKNANIYKELVTLKKGNLKTITLTSNVNINKSDLLVIGNSENEVHKVLVTKISKNGNFEFKIEGVDYAPEIFEDLDVIPSFDTGLVELPDSKKNIDLIPLNPISKRNYGVYLGALSEVPLTAFNSDYFLYTGPNNQTLFQYHYYIYDKSLNKWIETIDSNIVIRGSSDAIRISNQKNTIIYAHKLFSDLIAIESGNSNVSSYTDKYTAKGDLNNLSLKSKGFYLSKNGEFKVSGAFIDSGVSKALIETKALKIKENLKSIILLPKITSENSNNYVAKKFIEKLKESNLISYRDFEKSDEVIIYLRESFDIKISSLPNVDNLLLIVSSQYDDKVGTYPIATGFVVESRIIGWKKYLIAFRNKEKNEIINKWVSFFPYPTFAETKELCDEDNLFPFSVDIIKEEKDQGIFMNLPNENELLKRGQIYADSQGVLKIKL